MYTLLPSKKLKQKISAVYLNKYVLCKLPKIHFHLPCLRLLPSPCHLIHLTTHLS